MNDFKMKYPTVVKFMHNEQTVGRYLVDIDPFVTIV